MKRKFYYHPDNAKAVTTALIERTLVADDLRLTVASEYMPQEDADGKPILGWWVEEWEPQDWLLMPPPFDPNLFEYPKMLLDLAQLLSRGGLQ